MCNWAGASPEVDGGSCDVRVYSAEWPREEPRSSVPPGYDRARRRHRCWVSAQVRAGFVEFFRDPAIRGGALLAMRRHGVRIPSPVLRGQWPCRGYSPSIRSERGTRCRASSNNRVEGSMFVQVTATIRATTQCRRASRARTRGLRFKSGPAVALEERDVIRVVVECVLVALVCSVCPLAWAPSQWAACVQAGASDARHRTSRKPKTYESDVVVVIQLVVHLKDRARGAGLARIGPGLAPRPLRTTSNDRRLSTAESTPDLRFR